MPTNDSTDIRTPEAPAEQQTRVVFVADHRSWDVSIYRRADRFTADALKAGAFLVELEGWHDTPQQALEAVRVEIDLTELRLGFLRRQDQLTTTYVARAAMAAELDDQHLASTRRLAGEHPAVQLAQPEPLRLSWDAYAKKGGR